MYKKKKKTGKVIILCLIAMVAVVGIYLYSVHKNQNQLAVNLTDTSEQVILLEGQRVEKLKIKAIYGNEIYVNIAETDTSQEQQIWQIPVGTDVVTKLGTITTFSRLANGDVIDALIQTDDNGNETIQKVWITE